MIKVFRILSETSKTKNIGGWLYGWWESVWNSAEAQLVLKSVGDKLYEHSYYSTLRH